MTHARFALHGGAGVIDRELLSPEREASYRAELQRIAAAAWQLLEQGASAVDVVDYAVQQLEDCPLFNAGHGAVLNRDGVVELDAAIMDGRDRSAGAVGAAQRTRHPVALARRIMAHGEHVLLAGPAADRFALEQGLELVEPDWFVVPERAEQLRLARLEGRVTLDHDNHFATLPDQPSPSDKSGTVGAVARDRRGHLAAATSTGGMTNKIAGRLGDSPIIGAGTWADDDSCCISATGHGEYFMRCAVAYDVHARIVYGGQDALAAAEAVLDRVAGMGGSGGLVGIDRGGRLFLPFNSPGMYRAWVGADGEVEVAIYREE